MKILLLGLLVGTLIWTTGCAKEQPPDKEVTLNNQSLPKDLEEMQGEWKSPDESVVCRAQIEDYTIRLAYETEDGTVQSKRNVRIKKLDTVNHRLQVYGEKEPWQYLLEYRNQQDLLSLHFYDEQQGQWVQTHLQRVENTDLVAGL